MRSMIAWIICLEVHHFTSFLSEKLALHGFCEKITIHFFRRAPFDRQFVIFDLINRKEMTNIDVLRPLAAGWFAVLLEQDRAFVVLA